MAPDPTVVNASLSFVMELGFPEVYLFGTDMGVRGNGLHHAKDSYYFTPGSYTAKQNLVFDIEVPPNFGGKSLTSKGLYGARIGLARIINLSRAGTRFYNCSDGALIDGAVPTRSQNVDLPALVQSKSAVTEAIIREFPVLSASDFDQCWNTMDILAQVRDTAAMLRASVESVGSFAGKEYMEPLIELLQPGLIGSAINARSVETSILFMYRGTMLMVLVALEFILNRISEDKRSSVTPLIKEKILEVIGTLESIALDVLADPLRRELPEGDLQTPWHAGG